MVKRRPVVVLAPSRTNRQLVAVVPLSTTQAHQIGIAPCKGLLTVILQQQICHQSGEASVAIRIRVNPYQPVMKARTDFANRVRLVFELVADVVAEIAQLHGNHFRGNADVLL